MPENDGPHLRTQFVFIDTQAFRRARVNWSGRSWSRLVELAQQGQLRLLVTDVTTREVNSQLRELLAEATASLSKHSGLLQQLGVSSAIDRVRDQSAALSTLEAAFDQFLQDTRAINIPLISDLTGVLDDYFAQRPPFSTKKKSEFPDAISIASLRLWCEQNRATTYVVSEDGDLRACCSESGPLFHAGSINDIISRATVSQTLHDSLEQALNGSKYLSDTLAEKIKESATIEMSSGDWQVTTAEIEGVPSVRIISVRVLDQENLKFTCELEVEAEVEVFIIAERERHYRDDVDSFEGRHVHRTKIAYFYPEVIVHFDPSTGDLEFDSVHVPEQAVEVGRDDVVL
jgi:PIN domain